MRRLRKFLVVIAAGACCLLAGCSHEPVSGTVTGKSDIPAHVDSGIIMIPNTVCSGNPPICTTTYTYVPYSNDIPEEWVLHLRHCNAKNECSAQDASVTEQEYEQYRVGDYYKEKTVES